MRKKLKGFTLVELMLSVAFLSTLAIVIALLISHSASTYRKGALLKQVNEVGTRIIEDLRASMSNNHVGDMGLICDDYFSESSAREACKSDNGFNFVSLKRYAPVVIKGAKRYEVDADGEVPIYGVFCTGKYTYLWNSGYFYNSDEYEIKNIGSAPKFVYKRSGVTGTQTITNYRLLKIIDEKRQVCGAAVKAYATNSYGDAIYIEDIDELTNNFDISGGTALSEDPVELLSYVNGEGLALYNLEVSRPAQSGVQKTSFYAGSFILGSLEGGVNIGSSSDYCKAYVDEGLSANADYCSVNRFNFAVQTSGI